MKRKSSQDLNFGQIKRVFKQWPIEQNIRKYLDIVDNYNFFDMFLNRGENNEYPEKYVENLKMLSYVQRLLIWGLFRDIKLPSFEIYSSFIRELYETMEPRQYSHIRQPKNDRRVVKPISSLAVSTYNVDAALGDTGTRDRVYVYISSPELYKLIPTLDISVRGLIAEGVCDEKVIISVDLDEYLQNAQLTGKTLVLIVVNRTGLANGVVKMDSSKKIYNWSFTYNFVYDRLCNGNFLPRLKEPLVNEEPECQQEHIDYWKLKLHILKNDYVKIARCRDMPVFVTSTRLNY